MEAPRPDKRPSAVISRTGIFLLVLLVAFLAGAVWFAVSAWQRTEGVEISTHGMIAMGLGIIVTFLVGAVLMALVFWSSRKGYDR